MAKGYRPVDRDQSFLLPPDMRDWLPGSHLVWFVLDVVQQLDTSRFHARSRLGGVGREGYDPDMLLGVLVYAYCHGIRSSRAIERACLTDVAFRVLCAQDVPDHTRVARFRKDHEAALEDLFTQVLVLCARAGLGRLGQVAVDGTKIAANASILANRSEARLRELVAQMLAEAATVDAAEDAVFGSARGDELPDDWDDPGGRPARLRAAIEAIEAEKRALAERDAAERAARQDKALDRLVKAERVLAVQQDKRDWYEQQAARGAAPAGRKPVPPHRTRAMRSLRSAQRALMQALQAPASSSRAATAANTTDADSRVMKTQLGWVQGYNCQTAVTDDGLILAVLASQVPVDVNLYRPIVHAAVAAALLVGQARDEPGEIGRVLADAGYASEENLTADGPDRLIALGKARDLKAEQVPAPAPGPDATAVEVMAHRLSTPEGLASYRRRAATVEPVNGHLKDRRGLRRFARRGLAAANSELHFAAAVTNLMKMYTLSQASPG